MNWYERHIISVPHPLMPGMRVIGFVVSYQTALHPADEMAALVEPHPDTVRLDHLIKMDHRVLEEPRHKGEPAVEHINFIYDACPDAPKGINLRTAIDNSIRALKKVKA